MITSSKRLWDTVKKLRRQNINEGGVSALISQDGIVVKSDTEKANLLNYCFVELGENLAEKFADTSHYNKSHTN